MRNEDVIRNFLDGLPGRGSHLRSTGKELINFSIVIARHEGDGIHLTTARYSRATIKNVNMVRKLCSKPITPVDMIWGGGNTREITMRGRH